MSSSTPNLEAVLQTLLAAFGPQHWWPAESREEMIIGALLTQNTAWKNVEKGLARLRRQGGFDFEHLRQLPRKKLEEAIRPCGYFRQKSQRLQKLAAAILNAGGLDELARRPTAKLRQWLLGLYGIGPETADSILLYTFGRPVFVIDAYTLRIARRHDWLGEKDGYDTAQQLFTRGLPSDTRLFNEYHALLVRIGKDFCRPRQPDCQTCPLAGYLPDQIFKATTDKDATKNETG